MLSSLRIPLVIVMLIFACSVQANEALEKDFLLNLIKKHEKTGTYESLKPIEDIALKGLKKNGKYSAVESNAIYYLSDQYRLGIGVEPDQDKAYDLLSYITYQEFTHLQAAHRLSVIYLLDEQSKYFDLETGLEILRALSNIHKGSLALKSQLALAVALNDFKSKFTDQTAVEEEIEQAFVKAADQGHPGAHLNLYFIKKKLFSREPILINSAIENLRFAAENNWEEEYHSGSLQGASARTLAIIYFQGDLIEKSFEQYHRYLEIGASLEDVQSLTLLGKAYMNGVGVNVNNSKAKTFLIRAKGLGDDHATWLLAALEQRAKIEQEFSNFEPPESWFENFVAAQYYSQSLVSNDNFEDQNGLYTAKKPQKGVATYTFLGGVFRSSDGTRWNISKNTIRGSNGQTYRLVGSTIRSSNGNTYRLNGNTMRGSDGSRYTFSGNSMRSSNGVSCRRSGQKIRCY